VIVLPANIPRDARLAALGKQLAALPLDKAWSVDVKEWKPKRSDAQNRALWGVIYPAITERLEGWTLADVHAWCLGECYGWETVEGLGRKRLRPLRRSAKMSKREFSDYIAWIQVKMAEFGIVVPDPDPEWFNYEPA
jgi:hypothetical protein